MHALIVGEQGVGKSTLIQKVRKKLDLFETGFETVREKKLIEERGIPLFIYRIGSPRIQCRDNLAAFVGPDRKTSFPAAFERCASWLAEDAKRSELIVMDELGFLESEAPGFCESVLEILDADTPVIAAVKPQNTPFLKSVREHRNARVFQINRFNRNDLTEEVYGFLKKEK